MNREKKKKEIKSALHIEKIRTTDRASALQIEKQRDKEAVTATERQSKRKRKSNYDRQETELCEKEKEEIKLSILKTR